jgi:hypothetical protein
LLGPGQRPLPAVCYPWTTPGSIWCWSHSHGPALFRRREVAVYGLSLVFLMSTLPLVGDGDIPSGVSKLTVPEAARALDISPEAVRNRLSRGTLKSIKEEGTVYVLLEADRSQHISDIPTDRPRDISSELVDELRDRVRYLERVLEEEREARTEERRRHDTLMAQLMSRIPEIEAPPEAPEAPETATPQPGREDRRHRSKRLRDPQSAPGGGGCSRDRRALRWDRCCGAFSSRRCHLSGLSKFG